MVPNGGILSFQTGFARYQGESANPGLWQGLVGAWDPNLGPTGLVLRDQSGRGNDGMLMNMVVGAAWVTTPLGYAIDLAGDNSRDYIQLARKISFADREPWSFACWADIDVLYNFGGFFGNEFNEFVADTATRSLILNNGDLQIFNDANFGRTFAAVILTGKHHYALTRDAANLIRFYRDGKLLDSINRSGVFTINRIGNYGAIGGNSDSIDGRMSAIGVWNRDLTPDEIAHLHRDPLAPLRLRIRRPHLPYPAIGSPYYIDTGELFTTGPAAGEVYS